MTFISFLSLSARELKRSHASYLSYLYTQFCACPLVVVCVTSPPLCLASPPRPSRSHLSIRPTFSFAMRHAPLCLPARCPCPVSILFFSLRLALSPIWIVLVASPPAPSWSSDSLDHRFIWPDRVSHFFLSVLPPSPRRFATRCIPRRFLSVLPPTPRRPAICSCCPHRR